MKNWLLSCTMALTSWISLAQGNVLFIQDFETNMNGFTTFNEGPTSSAFTRGTPASFNSAYMPVPNLTGSTYCVGFNDDAAGMNDAGSDVYMMTPYADYSMYDSVRIYFDYHAPGDYQGGYVVVGQTGNFDNMFDNAIFYSMPNTTTWNSNFITVTPSTFDVGYGLNNVSIGFNYYDADDWAYGLVLDNITIIGYRQSPNDDCANAHSLTPVTACAPGTEYQGNMTGSGQSTETSLCYTGQNAPDVWFKFEATNTTATVRASSLVVYDLDILLEIYEGECGNFTLLHCQDADDITDNGTGEEIALLTDLTVGQTYYIRMFSVFGPTDLGGFRICVESTPATSCDEPVVTATETTICENQQTTLTVAGATNVQWQKDGVAIAGQTGISYSATEAGSYAVTLTDAGCTTVTSNAITIQVNATPTRTQTFTICTGETITVGTDVYSESGTFTTIVAATEGCDSTITTVLTVVNVTPEVDQANEIFTTTPINGATYQWINCANDEVVATTADFTATENGQYRLSVTAGNCTEETDCFVVAGLSIQTLAGFDVAIYPNPTNGNVTISAGKYLVEQVAIYDNNGRFIEVIQFNAIAPTLSVGHLSNGLYFLHVKANGNTVVQKVAKQF